MIYSCRSTSQYADKRLESYRLMLEFCTAEGSAYGFGGGYGAGFGGYCGFGGYYFQQY